MLAVPKPTLEVTWLKWSISWPDRHGLEHQRIFFLRWSVVASDVKLERDPNVVEATVSPRNFAS